jgi:hypothetical protein
VKVPFTLAGGASGSVALTFENVELVQGGASVVAGGSTGGSITVGVPCVPGDIFPDGVGSGTLTISDVVLGRRKALGTVAKNSRDTTCGDIAPGTIVCTVSNKTHWCGNPDGLFKLDDFVLLRRLLLGTYLYTCTSCGPQVGTAHEFVPGDIAPRGATDGVVNVSDVVTALRLSVGLDTPTADERAKADVAPTRHEGGTTLADGNGSVDVGDVVMLLRTAVGLDALAWPERGLAVRLETPSPHVGFQVMVAGWPEGVEPTGLDSSECTGDDATVEPVGSTWGLVCMTDPSIASGPSTLATIRYRGPRVDPASLAVTPTLVDSSLATVPARVTVGAP